MTDLARKTRRSKPKKDRRAQLINATIDSIATNGFDNTTMASVTKIAGVSVGLVNFHFSTKEALFEQTLRFLAEEHRDLWKESYEKAELNPAAKLLAICEAHFDPRICSPKKLAVWFAFYGHTTNRSKYREIMAEIDPERWNLSTDLLQTIIDAEAHTVFSATEIAHHLEAMYDGFCLNVLMYPDQFSHSEARTTIRKYLASIFPKTFHYE